MFINSASQIVLSNRVIGTLRIAALVLAFGLNLASALAQYINITRGGAFAPGLYGELAIGVNPLPPVWNREATLIEPSNYPPAVVYIYAPVEHMNNWRFYCRQYNACQRAVFFVRVQEQNRWWERRLERAPMPDNSYILERERRLEYPGEIPWGKPREEHREEHREERRLEPRDERREEHR